MGRARGEEILTLTVDVERLRTVGKTRTSDGSRSTTMTPDIFRGWVKNGAPTWNGKNDDQHNAR